MSSYGVLFLYILLLTSFHEMKIFCMSRVYFGNTYIHAHIMHAYVLISCQKLVCMSYFCTDELVCGLFRVSTQVMMTWNTRNQTVMMKVTYVPKLSDPSFAYNVSC